MTEPADATEELRYLRTALARWRDVAISNGQLVDELMKHVPAHIANDIIDRMPEGSA